MNAIVEYIQRFFVPVYRRTVLIAAIVALVIDQVTKWIAMSQGLVTLNTGISFGLFSGGLLTIGLIIAYVICFEVSCRLWHRAFPIPSGIFLGAALSNIVDRLVFGGVRDFLPVPVLNVQNNLADWMIMIALAWLFWKTNYGKNRTAKTAK